MSTHQFRARYSFTQARAMWRQVEAAEVECKKAGRRVVWLMTPGHLGNPFIA